MSQARPGTCQAAGQWPGAALRLRLVRVTGTLRTSSRRWPGPAAHRAADGEQVGPADGLARQHLLDHLLGRLCARRTALLPSLAWGPCSSRCTTTALFPFLAWRPCTSRCTTIALFYFYQKKKRAQSVRAGVTGGPKQVRGLTQTSGKAKRCRPPLDGQSNSKRMDPFALRGTRAAGSGAGLGQAAALPHGMLQEDFLSSQARPRATTSRVGRQP